MGGETQYKRFSCLRFYGSLVGLQLHIAYGWKEGFSCRVFYQKLKEMQEKKRAQKSSQESTTDTQSHSLSNERDTQSGGRKSKTSEELLEPARKKPDLAGFASSSHCPKELLKPILFSLSARPPNRSVRPVTSKTGIPLLQRHLYTSPRKPSQNPIEDDHNSKSPLHGTWEVNQESDLLDFKFIRTISSKECMGGEVQYKCASCLRYFRSLGFLQAHIVNGWKEGFSCRVFYRKLKEIQGKRRLKRSQESFMLPATKIQHFSPLIDTEAPRRTRKTKVSWDLSEVKRKTDAIQKWLLEIQQPDTTH
ncbi:UNVERIFIED_CONTAM: hypothetical protein FKN15_028807 [Acipenser sinensis]